MGDAGPDPGPATDLAEFVRLLNELRVWAGSPSYRTLARRVGPRLRPPQVLSQSTVGDMFQPGRRRLNLDLVVEIVRALGLDAAGVARWRAACVRVHAEAKSGGPAGVLRQLPADLATFTGREADLAALERLVAPRDGRAPTVVISAIEGMGGAGKTQLAVHAAHRLVRAGRYTDVQLFVNLRGFDPDQSPADPAEVLGSFLHALDIPVQQLPAGLDERAAMFRDRIHGRRALIVLDNASGEEQVRSLIPGGPDCLVLITSRRSMAGLDGAVPHHLGMFAPQEALALLGRIIGPERVAAEPEAAERIVALCGRLPLAVALVAARLRSRPSWRLADLVRNLPQAGLRGLRTGGRDVSAILDLSYNGLPPAARRAFRLLSLHPGADLTVASAAALIGSGSADAHAVLELLLDEHLLQQSVPDRYEFHDLVRLHGRHLAAADDEAVRSAASRRLLDHYRHAASVAMDLVVPYEKARRPEIPTPTSVEPMAFHEVQDAESWLRDELSNLVQAVAATADGFLEGHAADLSTILARHLEERGLHHMALVLHHRALAATRGEASSERQADASRHLGVTYWKLAMFQEAVAHYERALSRYEASGNLVGMGSCSGILGMLALNQGRSRPALDRFSRSQELFAQAGDRLGESRAFNALGNAHRRMGRLARSVECYDRAIDLASRATGRPDAPGTALGNRGITRMRQGDYERAMQDLLASLAIMREGGHQGYCEILTDLGNLHTRLGRAEEALAYLSESLKACHDSGHRAAEGWALIGFGELHHRAGEHAETLDTARRALTLAEVIGEHSVRVHAHNGLGRAEAALGRLEVAAEHHRTALELARTSDDAYQQAKALEGLADVHRRRGEPGPAAGHEQSALRLYRELGVPEADGIAGADRRPTG